MSLANYSWQVKRRRRMSRLIYLSPVLILSIPTRTIVTTAHPHKDSRKFHNAQANSDFQRLLPSIKRSSFASKSKECKSSVPRSGEENIVFGTSSLKSDDDGKSAPKNILASCVGSFLSFIQDPDRMGMCIKTLQIALWAFLIRGLFKTVQEVSRELAAGDNEDPPYAEPGAVSHLLDLLELQPNKAETALKAKKNGGMNNNIASLPPLPLVRIARKLLACGLPPRSSPGEVASIESVLLKLTRSEVNLMEQCLWVPPSPSQGKVNSAWNNIAGLELIKERLLDALTGIKGKQSQSFASLFDSPNQSTPKGVLLYGPPGCGKTMLVRSLATVSRLPCLVVTPSVLLRKYVGETNLRVRSLFSLASKLAPCILCIDELDGLFRERSDSENEVTRELKTEFLQWWDGLTTASNHNEQQLMFSTNDPAAASLPDSNVKNGRQIMVVGATNRPFDVDSAVLRRISQSHYVGLPDAAARSVLLNQLLSKVPTSDHLDVSCVVERTEGYSPSDLKQLLQTAALMGPMRECRSDQNMRCLTTEDILLALTHVPPTPMTEHYRTALGRFANVALPSFSREASGISIFPNSDSEKRETNLGNFYNFGTLEVDLETFDLLTNLVRNMTDTENDDYSD